ncbi:TetR/AcrR family transcriptional regulator [Streptomyces corynorhini]|uniref:TetR/AcrR family transcriptional regulator n=1 Tax=Streptomyces corynorhini TaxID=2282652 RepID=A0A370B7W5_9ACTN|nr:helix-turn-helix domain-containing protein [Streptomyces corynorhini]RDG37691.1 TetR/AcrR family transcriptional regulator [Streptomyces corynorhini]
MSVAGTKKPVRARSGRKQAAILDAGRELFLQHGVDRVTMDTVAARAGVSKATVYSHFGDKRRLFLAILHDASESLAASAGLTLERYLADDAAIETLAELEAALTAAASDIGTTMVGSADYAAVFALVARHRQEEPESDADVSMAKPEEAFAERITHFTSRGLLDADDAALAVDHFIALTVLRAYNHHPTPSVADLGRVREIIADGVHVFIRAYGAR